MGRRERGMNRINKEKEKKTRRNKTKTTNRQTNKQTNNKKKTLQRKKSKKIKVEERGSLQHQKRCKKAPVIDEGRLKWIAGCLEGQRKGEEWNGNLYHNLEGSWKNRL